MSKYFRLKEFLCERNQDAIPMTFVEIEEILRFPLPASKQYPAWWSNNPSNNPMTQEWLDAGYETESVNIPNEKLVFRKVRRSSARDRVPRQRHPGFGFMKGLIKIQDGFDVTKSFDDEPWDLGYLGEDRLNDGQS